MASELARRLREARVARGVSLQEVERETKIRRRYLEAIEAGDFSRLPDGPPARGFIRIYARFLGLDPERALSDFEAEVGVPLLLAREKLPPPPSSERPRPTSQLTQLVSPELRWKGSLPDEQMSELDALADAEPPALPSRSAIPEERVPMVTHVPTLRASRSSFRLRRSIAEHERIDSHIQTSHVAKPRTRMMSLRSRDYSPYVQRAGSALLALALVAVAAFLIVNFVLPWIRTNLNAPIADQQAEAPSIEVTFFSTPQPTSAPLVVTPPEPAVAPTGGLQIMLDVREPAWLRVRVDGNLVYSDTPPLGLTAPFNAERSIALETNNGGAFEVVLNGQRIGPLGPRGERIQKVWGSR